MPLKNSQSPGSQQKMVTAWQVSTQLDEMENSLSYISKYQQNVSELKQIMPQIQSLKTYDQERRSKISEQINQLHRLINEARPSGSNSNTSLKYSASDKSFNSDKQGATSDRQRVELVKSVNQYKKQLKQNTDKIYEVKHLEVAAIMEEQAYYRKQQEQAVNEVKQMVEKAKQQVSALIEAEKDKYFETSGSSAFEYHVQSRLSQQEHQLHQHFQRQISKITANFDEFLCKKNSLKDRTKKKQIKLHIEKVKLKQQSTPMLKQHTCEHLLREELSKAQLQTQIDALLQEIESSRKQLSKKVSYCVDRLKLVIFQQRKLEFDFERDLIQHHLYDQKKVYFDQLFLQYSDLNEDLISSLTALPKYFSKRYQKIVEQTKEVETNFGDNPKTVKILKSNLQNLDEIVKLAAQDMTLVLHNIGQIDKIQFIGKSDNLSSVLWKQ